MLVILGLDLIILDETYANVILVNKAKDLRQTTGDWALHAKHEGDLHIADLARKFLMRPWLLLATPICFFMIFYSSFVYGLVFM